MVTTRTLSELTDTPHAEVFPDAHPRAVRLSLDAGESLPEHTHPGTDVLFHVLDGRVTVTLDSEAHVLQAGEIARFDGERSIAPTAETDATALVVLAERPEA